MRSTWNRWLSAALPVRTLDVDYAVKLWLPRCRLRQTQPRSGRRAERGWPAVLTVQQRLIYRSTAQAPDPSPEPRQIGRSRDGAVFPKNRERFSSLNTTAWDIARAPDRLAAMHKAVKSARHLGTPAGLASSTATSLRFRCAVTCAGARGVHSASGDSPEPPAANTCDRLLYLPGVEHSLVANERLGNLIGSRSADLAHGRGWHPRRVVFREPVVKELVFHPACTGREAGPAAAVPGGDASGGPRRAAQSVHWTAHFEERRGLKGARVLHERSALPCPCHAVASAGLSVRNAESLVLGGSRRGAHQLRIGAVRLTAGGHRVAGGRLKLCSLSSHHRVSAAHRAGAVKPPAGNRIFGRRRQAPAAPAPVATATRHCERSEP